MKNLIITAGIMLLMVMGILYDLDCTEVMHTTRRLAWTCQEMAAAAAISRWEQGNTEEEAKSGAAEILLRNLYLNRQAGSERQAGIIEGDVRWEIQLDKPYVTVSVDGGMGKTRLPFLQGQVALTYRHTYDFSSIFVAETL
jgi:hypothetical protein